MGKIFATCVCAIALLGCKAEEPPPTPEPETTDAAVPAPKPPAEPGKPNGATDATKAANEALLNELPFADAQSFADAKKGLIAPLPSSLIKGEAGNTIWDPTQYDFIEEGVAAPDTVNPSLWRQSQLINIAGLFEVSPRIYQVRNQDLSNMTIIEGKSGIIVVDPLIWAETAKAALDLYYEHRPKKPVRAVIYSHSHVDHYGGVRGVVHEEDVKSGKVQVVAPVNFTEKAASENVLAGNAMSRRASYMYGNLLPPDPKGQVGAGLGTTTSAGTITLIQPTTIISKTGQKVNVDGLTFEFLWAPGTEAPTEMHWYIPQLKAISTAENATHTLHNTYSLRGAAIRNPLSWSKFLNQTLQLWGDDVEMLFGMHHWPVWGNAQVKTHLKLQRDLYRYINDQTLRLLNSGHTMVEIAEMFELPKSLAHHWSNRGYYGSVNHDVKATYVLYLGWFDGNPGTLHALPPVEASQKYVEYMGGADTILARARSDYAEGNYRWVAEAVNHVVFADPANQEAKNLQADALEQMGYQAESGPWRNFYLTGAQELRNGVAKLPTPNTASADTIKAMSLDLMFDYLGSRLDGPKAADQSLTLNVVFPDTKQKYLLEIANGVLNHTANAQSEDAGATITMSRETLNNIILRHTTMKDAIAAGEVTVDGDQAQLDTLLGLLVTFEFWFNIVTP